MELGIVSRIGEFPEKFWEGEFELASKEKLEHIELLVSSKYLSPVSYTNEQIKNINSLSKINNLEIIMHPWLNELFLKDKEFFNLASTDDEVRGLSIETAGKIYSMAKKIDAKIVSVHGGFFKSFSDYDKNLKRARESLELLNPLFKDVKLCIENLPVKGHFNNLVKELPIEVQDILYLVDGLENVGICFDIGHANTVENALDFYDKIKKSGKIWNIHVHDNDSKQDDHLPLGKGNIDFKRFLQKLKQDNYQGYFSVELDTFCEEEMEQEERIAALKYLRSLGLQGK